MRKICSLLLCAILIMSPFGANAEGNISVTLNGDKVYFKNEPIIVDGRTMIHLRSFTQLFDYDLNWDDTSKTITLSSNKKDVVLRIDSPYVITMTDSGMTDKKMDVPPMIVDGSTYIPLRSIAEIFDAQVKWNEKKKRVELTTDDSDDYVSKKSQIISDKNDDKEIEKNHTFYFQNDEQWQLPNCGSSYCWVMCYAMILNDIVGDVTPNDVAAVNEEMCGDGAFCYHYPIVEKFGVKFGKAIDSDSLYFKEFKDGYATYIENEEKDDTVAIAAIKEALDKHPEGVMVRFEGKPHTIVAVAYEDDTIYFNDPVPYNYGQYETENPYEYIEFEETYPAKMGFSISDFVFLEAIDTY
ncbi:MAG: copper amine oxidase N-terminal domain-containing protein [Ruminococcaceae bacterium]|nr:copper amine oxidase N-terminal domain-containing protein [Oscillospiraceae bacterium]